MLSSALYTSVPPSSGDQSGSSQAKRCSRRCCGARILGYHLPPESAGCHEEPSAGSLVLITGSGSTEAVTMNGPSPSSSSGAWLRG
eukprot:s614_g18.t1